MKTRALVVVAFLLLLLIAFAVFRSVGPSLGEGLRITVLDRRFSEPPAPSWVKIKRSYGEGVPTNSYPVLSVEITNTTSKTFRVFSNDGKSVLCEYRDRTESGWTNWVPRLDYVHIAMVLKPHSRLPALIRLREDGGERQFRILCYPELPSPRLPGFLRQLETRFYSQVLRPGYSVRLPFSSIAPLNGPAAPVDDSGVTDGPSLDALYKR